MPMVFLNITPQHLFGHCSLARTSCHGQKGKQIIRSEWKNRVNTDLFFGFITFPNPSPNKDGPNHSCNHQFATPICPSVVLLAMHAHYVAL